MWMPQNTPICLPPKESWENKFIGYSAKISGYGRITSVKVQGKDDTSCTLQVAYSSIVKAGHESCRKVSNSVSFLTLKHFFPKKNMFEFLFM